MQPLSEHLNAKMSTNINEDYFEDIVTKLNSEKQGLIKIIQRKLKLKVDITFTYTRNGFTLKSNALISELGKLGKLIFKDAHLTSTSMTIIDNKLRFNGLDLMIDAKVYDEVFTDKIFFNIENGTWK